jgi:bifunctional polynucleotide phosphatase/kinase
VSAIVKKLDLPMLVFLATRDDLNRKPRVNAWTRMVEMLKPDGSVTKGESFYCGDAAGRPKAAGRAKDFAATDYKFALNLGVPFLTPEALFLDSKQRLHTHPSEWEIGFDPRSVPVASSSGGERVCACALV